MGLLGTWATGPTNLEDLDQQLISPPVLDLLNSLPNKLKEYFNVPMKMARQNEKLITNFKTGDLELARFDNVVGNECNWKIDTKIYRKISAP